MSYCTYYTYIRRLEVVQIHVAAFTAAEAEHAAPCTGRDRRVGERLPVGAGVGAGDTGAVAGQLDYDARGHRDRHRRTQSRVRARDHLRDAAGVVDLEDSRRVVRVSRRREPARRPRLFVLRPSADVLNQALAVMVRAAEVAVRTGRRITRVPRQAALVRQH